MRISSLAISAILLPLIFFPSSVFAQYQKGNLYSESRAGNLKAIKKLITKKTSQEELNDALQAAVSGDKEKTTRHLIRKGADPDLISVGPNSLLINAIMYDYLNAARALVKSGANVKVRGYKRINRGFQIDWNWTALMCAAYKGDFKLFRMLIRKGADIHATGWSSTKENLESAADIAAYSGHVKILKFLLKKRVKLNPSMIYQAARGGHTEMVQYLLSRGANINAPGPDQGKTLLMEASWFEHPDLVNFLLNNGADANKPDAKGRTTLSIIINNIDETLEDPLEIIKLLLQHGADVNQADINGITPLMRAKNANVIRLLVTAGAR